MAASNQAHYIFIVDLGVKPATNVAIYSALYRGFKLATSMFVLSTFDVYFFSHIPQALHFYYILRSFWEPEPVC